MSLCYLLFIVCLVIATIVSSSTENLTIQQLLKRQDAIREKQLLSSIHKIKSKFKPIQNKYFQVTSQTFTDGCETIKSFGGQWAPAHGTVDGAKDVCMDLLMPSLASNQCLIYSFGIADDWSFEDAMDQLGCRVRTFDPTIDAPPTRGRNITFNKIGIAHLTGDASIDGNEVEVHSLSDILEMFHEEDKEISYLKVDVEGWEIDALPEWPEEGVLENVKQIEIEMHMGTDDDAKRYTKLIKAFQKLYKLGYRPVTYHPNMVVEKILTSPYHSHFDLLLVKK